jgi:tRNA pseudouridine55 synthase
MGQEAGADPNFVLSVTTALADIPALALTSREIADLKQGLALSLVTLMGRIPEAANPDDGLVRLMAEESCVALGRMAEGLLRTERFLQP